MCWPCPYRSVVSVCGSETVTEGRVNERCKLYNGSGWLWRFSSGLGRRERRDGHVRKAVVTRDEPVLVVGALPEEGRSGRGTCNGKCHVGLTTKALYLDLRQRFLLSLEMGQESSLVFKKLVRMDVGTVTDRHHGETVFRGTSPRSPQKTRDPGGRVHHQDPC